MLDINTPRGAVSLADELQAAMLFEAAYRSVRYAHTEKTEDAKVDAVLIKDQVKLVGLALTSCRYDYTLEKLRDRYDFEWLLTWRKLALGALLSRHLRAPLFGFLYIVDEQRLLVRKFYDGHRWVVPLRRERTMTRATINGGQATRLNAYVKMDGATEVEIFT